MQLNQQSVRELFDYKDGFLYWKVKPKQSRVDITKPSGCINKQDDGHRRHVQIKGKQYNHSRLVFLYHKGYLPKIVDHENHNTVDDRIENLRDADFSKNMRNRTSARGSSSKYLGVCITKGKYIQATIKSNGINTHLGSFKNEIDAALAYDKAAKEIHGKFANLNFKNNGNKRHNT